MRTKRIFPVTILSAALLISSNIASAQLEEIVVTARKTAEDIQDVPISISAFSGDAIEELGVEDLADVAKFAPNVSFDGAAAVSGSSIGSTVFIRGIGQTDFTLNSDPGVGIYIDGVYVARSIGGLLDLVEIDTVEVLRGPQGTLFGKNTIGGAINVRSKMPDQELGGFLEVQAGNFSRLNVKAGANLPLSETFAANVAFAVLNQDGYQERILQPEADELGNIDRFVGRTRLAWTPTDEFSADLAIDFTRGREQSVPQTVIDFNLGTGALFLPAAAGLIPGSTAQVRPEFAGNGFTGAQFANGDFIVADPRRTFYGGPSRSDFDIFGSALTLSYDFGGVQLKSITAYREIESDFARDSLSSPFLAADTVDRYDQEQFSQEIQLLGDYGDGRGNYVVGAFWLSEEGVNDNLVDTSIGGLGSGGAVDNDSFAVFAQTSFDLSDTVGITAGVRFTDEEKRFDPGFRGGEQLFTVSPNGAAIGLPPAGATIPLIVAPESLGLGQFYENSDDKVDFTFALNYSLNENTLLYGSISSGFKAGGFSQRIGPGPGVPAPDFRREDVVSYEVGLKSTSLNDTLRFNAAVFATEYDDLQVTPIFEGIGPVTRNIGDAEIWGFEFEWNYVPNDVFEWTGGVGYLDDELTSLTPEAAVNVDLMGNQILTLDTELAKTPEWSVSSAASYRIAMGTDADVFLRANWSYTSSMFNDVLNSESLRRPALHLFGASIDYEKGAWVFSITGNNLTDEEYIVTGNDETAAAQFGYTQATYARPREWWASVRRSF